MGVTASTTKLMASQVLVEDQGPVRILTLNRPQKLNAMTSHLYDELRDCLVASALDRSVKCLIVTGAGRAFCAGQDLKEMASPEVVEDGKPHGASPCIEEIERFPKPLLAAVNGLGVGFGMTFLLHCDLVLASNEARFRLPFLGLGLAPEAGSSATLALRVGEQEAAHLLYTGSWCNAQRAVEIGLVWKLTPPQEVLSSTVAIAHQIAEMPLASLVATKKLLLGSRLETIRAATARARRVCTAARPPREPRRHRRISP